jgi:hypothetical protein
LDQQRRVKLRVQGHRVEWNGGALDLPIPATQAIRLGERILVIHDYMAYDRAKPAPNLVAYNLFGERVWTAQNLTQGSATDAYVNFLSEEPLWRVLRNEA